METCWCQNRLFCASCYIGEVGGVGWRRDNEWLKSTLLQGAVLILAVRSYPRIKHTTRFKQRMAVPLYTLDTWFVSDTDL